MFIERKLFAFIIIIFAFAISIQSVQASAVFIFNKNLQTGNTSNDVKELQKFLNNNGFPLSKSGIGSLGKETTFFGSVTKNALVKFQKANKIIPAVGYFGPITRKAINKIVSSLTVNSNQSAKKLTSEKPAQKINNNYYTVSGSITGVVGAVVLQNNGKDDLTIDIGQNSNFTFKTTLADGANYSVTVKPKYLGQNCYANNNIGIVKGANIKNIKIACGANLSYNPFTFVFSGGGGSSRPTSPAVTAPSTLSYSSPNLFIANTAISTLSPTVSGSVDNYSISPDLPVGLSLNTTNGQITGTPTATTTQTTYTVTATNAGGSTTFEIVIMVDGTVVGANGKIWLDRNLGATRVATSATDYLAYGDLFQWGRPADGHELTTWTGSNAGSAINGTQSGPIATVTPATNTFIIVTSDWSNADVSGATRSVNWGSGGLSNPCPSGFRLPTKTEIDTERASWSSQNKVGAFASSLKLPSPGIRENHDGSFSSVGLMGFYWSNSPYLDSSDSLAFANAYAVIVNRARGDGYSIRCTANPYAVVYNDNGSIGGTVPSSQNKTHDVVLVLASNSGSLIKTGYTFSGWNTSANATGTDYAVSADYTINDSVILYAKWTINTYSVTFNTNGGDGGSTATQTLNYNTPTNLTTNGFTRTGYTFAGWSTTTDGAVAYADGASYTIGTENITLYAKWNPVLVVGASYQGGKIAYILQSGDLGYVTGETHGLIVSLADLSTGIYWHATNDGITNATGTAIGTGLSNTNAIVATYGEETNAAKLAYDYTNAETGTGVYSDWYLPSKDELNKLYVNRVAIGIGNNFYWSSSELTSSLAWQQWIFTGGQDGGDKNTASFYVRAIRSF